MTKQELRDLSKAVHRQSSRDLNTVIKALRDIVTAYNATDFDYEDTGVVYTQSIDNLDVAIDAARKVLGDMEDEL